MEKSAYNSPPYPQMPAEMNAAVGASSSFSGHHAMPAPPTYEQATHTADGGGSGGYPPVQVLPTPNANTFNRPPQQPSAAMHQHQQQQQQQPQQVFVSGIPNAQYVGVTVGGGGNGWSAPPPTSYPHQQQGAPQPMMQQPVVIVQQQAVIPLGPEPAYVLCPFCHIQKMTRTEHEPSGKTHLMAALLCLLGLWCCVCFPYCAESCMNTNHYCGNCNKFLGTYADSL